MEKKPLFLEICCGSAEDAIEAAKGGAHRVELNSDLFHGGLTPTIGSLIVAKRHIGIPIMCMVRPREGGFCYTDAEFEVMLEDARALIAHGADGIVFGFLDKDGRVDRARTAKMLGIVGDRDSVFHRAIDVVPDAFEVLDTLIDLGVKRVLTSGQRPTVSEGAGMIRRMIEHAAGRIEILPGGGITLSDVRRCRDEIGFDRMHAAVHRVAYDLSCRFNTSIYFGGAIYPPEDRFLIADAQKIAELYKLATE
ncbi:MAG: copper homeostasis protein CutC [Clostridiales bacterium]|jgi:copper homeostasis protein|nr:copper homeostasis protein CutC [Clostridiales bacterium]OPZ68673.1 MAG: Copper homeostasis protein CutC [Firmicutes bacterium ADurb.Bin467]